MTDFPIVPFDLAAHGDALFEFLERVLGADARKNRRTVIEWMHESMPGRDREPLRYVILDGDRIAGSMGHMPTEFVVEGRTVAARFTHDLLVDPTYRGKGLAKRIVENAVAQGDFFPGGMWMTDPCYKIHLASGFDDVKPIVTQTLVLDPDAFVRRKELGGVKAGVSRAALGVFRARALKGAERTERAMESAGLRILEASEFDAALDGAWRAMVESYGVSRARNAEYLNWRYVHHPRLTYRIHTLERDGAAAGYIVWRPPLEGDPERRAVVTDFLVQNGDADALRFLTSRVVNGAAETGAGILYLLTTQEWAGKTLRSMGFVPRRGRQTWVVAGWRGVVPETWLADHRPWHVCSGDSDGDMWTTGG